MWIKNNKTQVSSTRVLPSTDDITGSPDCDNEGVYLDGEEGDIVKLFNEASNLLTICIIVEPRTPLNLDLRNT